jgi:hypothetical protein
LGAVRRWPLGRPKNFIADAAALNNNPADLRHCFISSAASALNFSKPVMVARMVREGLP